MRRSTPRVMPRLLLSLFFAGCLASPVFAQTPLIDGYAAPGTTGYDASIPTPEEVLGYAIGERHTRPHEVVRYFEVVAEASDRVVLAQHGTTYGRRPLIHATVTSSGNHARLEVIRQANLRLSESPNGVSDGEISAMPAIVYLAYSVHGNEASGTEAALLTLYHLAAGQGPAVEHVLDNAVVIIDPMLNPDGRDRFTNWANSYRSPAAPTLDTQDREHNEAWPGGRTNHYFFDLNRDWLPAQFPESRSRLEVFHNWRPQFVADFHEMGAEATYFFQPGIPSRTNPNTPEQNQILAGAIAEHHAEAFDAVGQLYYSEESFDDFYYGKGSTYPDVNGAVGVLFEQASSRALQRTTSYGSLHYATTVRNQFIASLSSLEGVLANREALLRFQRDTYRDAPNVAGRVGAQGYVVAMDRYPQRAAELVRTLQRHRIQVYELARPVQAGGRRFEPGKAFVVPFDQPQAQLIKAMFEEVTTFEDSLFYDVSAWTFPYAFGLQYGAVSRMGGLRGGMLGNVSSGRGNDRQAAYAYLMPWGHYFAPRALYRLQRAGIVARLSFEAFETTVAGARRSFERGTIVIPVQQAEVDRETVHQLVNEAREADGIEIVAVSGGLTPGGPDLGSRSAATLEKPSVAVLSGPGTSSYRVGEAWHLLSERMQIPVSLIDKDGLAQLDLDRYTTIVAGGLSEMEEADQEALLEWVRDGGTFIATGQAAGWASENGFLEAEQDELEPDSTRIPYADQDETAGAQQISGAIFEIDLDTTHPLGFGHPNRVAVFKTNTLFFESITPTGNDVGVYTDEPLLSGYISGENLERLAGKSAIMAAEQGDGHVVVMDFEPTFRAFWYGTDGLLLNAVFFGGAF
ncbi:MAG: peptidase M14 [Bacteroidetes bacterium]|nr:peptidase M14 [Bacteroidota bacterium]